MTKLLKIFSIDNIVGKLCLLGIFAPLAVGILRLYISQKSNQDFYITTWYMSWELWVYSLFFIWFCVAIFRAVFSRRCPNCLSANTSKIDQQEIERSEGVITETIEVDKNVLTGSDKYESYYVPTTFTKTKFFFNCHNCQEPWEIVTAIPD